MRPAPMDTDYGELIGEGRVHLALADDPAARTVHGLIVLVPEQATMLVENVAVRPQLHRHGIGHALLAFAEAQAGHTSACPRSGCTPTRR